MFCKHVHIGTVCNGTSTEFWLLISVCVKCMIFDGVVLHVFLINCTLSDLSYQLIHVLHWNPASCTYSVRTEFCIFSFAM